MDEPRYGLKLHYAKEASEELEKRATSSEEVDVRLPLYCIITSTAIMCGSLTLLFSEGLTDFYENLLEFTMMASSISFFASVGGYFYRIRDVFVHPPQSSFERGPMRLPPEPKKETLEVVIKHEYPESTERCRSYKREAEYESPGGSIGSSMGGGWGGG